MTEDKGILIKNIYYMLTYAFKVLKQEYYESICGEEFDKIHNLFAEILARGITFQLKQGLHKEYVEKIEEMNVLHGKLDFNVTMKNILQQKKVLGCQIDELSENNLFNKILKTTVTLLIKSKDVSKVQKVKLKRLMTYFCEVDVIDPSLIKWRDLKFQRNNKNYEMLLNICYFVIENLLLTTEQGDFKMVHFSEKNMARLFEKFVLEYYKQHFPELKPRVAEIEWDVSGEVKRISLLPKMRTDITLQKGNKVLIIDTKYYSKMLNVNPFYDSQSYKTANLYQMFAYVSNWNRKDDEQVSGLLLYAKTNEDIEIENSVIVKGHKISVKCLDLNCPFKEIECQLKKIVEENFE